MHRSHNIPRIRRDARFLLATVRIDTRSVRTWRSVRERLWVVIFRGRERLPRGDQSARSRSTDRPA